MEETTTPNLRSRSRSKTPSIQLNHDREEVAIENGQTKSGRKTPVISRDTPTRLTTIDPIAEDSEPEVFTSPPAHRTRNALRHRTTPIPQTSEFSMDQNDFASTKTHIYSSTSEEQTQNLKNYAYEYERITTSSSYDRRRSANRTTVSPTGRPQPSPSGSERSNESFVDSILADCSRMSDDGVDHLPYRLYKSAVEYWNKYPKTDYTYSRLSKDRVELAPGQVAVPNMSRPSLHSAGWGGSSQDLAYSPGSSSYSSTETRQRYLGQNNYGNHRMHESISDTELDEATSSNYAGLKSRAARAEHWWITSLLITVWTTIVTTTTTVRDKILRRDGLQGYPYSAIRNYQAYSTRTEETTWYTSAAESVKRRRWWLLLLPLLLLPFAFLYTNPEYRETLTNYASLGVTALTFPNISLPQLSFPNVSFPNITLPEISMPEFSLPNISLPELSLPDLPSMPDVEMPEVFYEYKTAASGHISDFGKYISVLGQNWFNELQKLWNGIIS